ncbi:MAG: hypothetical protein WB816_00210 [Methylocystis sp.]
MSDEINAKSGAPMGDDELRALLRDVTAHRDKLLSQYEAMALQVAESTREINDDLLQAQEAGKKAEASEQRATQEAARAAREAERATGLQRQLDEERRKSAGVAEEFARFRQESERTLAEHVSEKNPRAMLWRAICLLTRDAVAWTRAKIPADSPVLPWFDRAVEGVTKAGCLAWKWANILVEWATPRVIDLWKRLKSEVAKRASKE